MRLHCTYFQKTCLCQVPIYCEHLFIQYYFKWLHSFYHVGSTYFTEITFNCWIFRLPFPCISQNQVQLYLHEMPKNSDLTRWIFLAIFHPQGHLLAQSGCRSSGHHNKVPGSTEEKRGNGSKSSSLAKLVAFKQPPWKSYTTTLLSCIWPYSAARENLKGNQKSSIAKKRGRIATVQEPMVSICQTNFCPYNQCCHVSLPAKYIYTSMIVSLEFMPQK